MPNANVGLCFCFSICCGQWACVCVCGSGLVFLICGHFGAIDEIFRGILFTVFSDVAVVGAAMKIEKKRKKDRAEVEKQKCK